jgi:hypothetical protein
MHALKFIRAELGGGGTSSLDLDAHGKHLGSCLWDMVLSDD